MRRMRADGETSPSVQKDWLIVFGNLVDIFRWNNIDDMIDCRKDDFDHMPFRECRFCRWKEKSAVAHVEFFNATKLTATYTSSLILEGRTMGGYPQADVTVFRPHNTDFPIRDIEWRGTLEPRAMGRTFPDDGRRDFSSDAVRSLAHIGDGLIRDLKEIHLALRSLQGKRCENRAIWRTTRYGG